MSFHADLDQTFGNYLNAGKYNLFFVLTPNFFIGFDTLNT